MSRLEIWSTQPHGFKSTDDETWPDGHTLRGHPRKWEILNQRLPRPLSVVLVSGFSEKRNLSNELPPLMGDAHRFVMSWNHSVNHFIPLTPWILLHRWHHAFAGKSLFGMGALDPVLCEQTLNLRRYQFTTWFSKCYSIVLDRSTLQEFQNSWQRAILKAVVSASSAQNGVLNNPDQHAEYWTASILQPQKWQHRINHWWQHLPKTLTLDIKQEEGDVIDVAAQAFWLENQGKAGQDCIAAINEFERLRVMTNLLLNTQRHWCL
jgi:hypothetical protein